MCLCGAHLGESDASGSLFYYGYKLLFRCILNTLIQLRLSNNEFYFEKDIIVENDNELLFDIDGLK